MKRALRTLKKCIRSRNGLLMIAGMLLGLAVVFAGANGMFPGKSASIITMVGAVVSMCCGNGLSQMITIYQQSED